MNAWKRLALAGVGIVLTATGGRADDTVYPHYFIAVDSLATLSSGAYAGLTNPNHNRLTLLLAHTYADPNDNHFHSKGRYEYTGPAGSPTVRDFNTANYVPEDDTRLRLLPGSGAFANKLVSGLDAGNEFEGLTLAPIQSLDVAGDEARQKLLTSSGGRWNTSLAGASLGLELVSLSAGLSVVDANGASLFGGLGDIYALGSGDNWSFTPVFTIDAATAAAGDYTAEFRLHDTSDTFGDGGRFQFRFQVHPDQAAVPEPGTFALLGALAAPWGAAALRGRRRRRRARFATSDAG